jgi:hypothetical protein
LKKKGGVGVLEIHPQARPSLLTAHHPLVDLPELIGYSFKFVREKRRIHEHGVF